MKTVALTMAGVLLVQVGAMAADFKQAHALGQQVTPVTTAGKIITVRENHPVRAVRVAPDAWRRPGCWSTLPWRSL